MSSILVTGLDHSTLFMTCVVFAVTFLDWVVKEVQVMMTSYNSGGNFVGVHLCFWMG